MLRARRGRRLWFPLLPLTPVSDGGRGTQHYLKSLSAHGDNYLKWCSLAILPVNVKSQKFLLQYLLTVRSAAISPGMQRYTILTSADPHRNHYFCLCSRWLEALKVLFEVSRPKKPPQKRSSCDAAYLPGFDFQIPSTTAELIIKPYPYKSLVVTSISYLFIFHPLKPWCSFFGLVLSSFPHKDKLFTIRNR